MRESIPERLLAGPRRGWAAGLLTAALVCNAATAFGGDLALARVTGKRGQPVSVPVLYRQGGGSAAAGLATDIVFDPTVLTHPRCTAGAALGSANEKTVKCAEPRPGLLRLLVYGLNLGAVPSGQVAIVTFDVAAGTQRRSLRLRHTPTAADANGKEIPLNHHNGAVRIERG
jgi:hypothetical protein